MFFVSTRNSKLVFNFKNAVLFPMPDVSGGLLTPSFLTPMQYNEIYDIANMSYPNALYTLIRNFCDGIIQDDMLKILITNAFKDFNKGCGMNSRKDNYYSFLELEENLLLADMTYGPTGCCKDYGTCLCAEIINFFAKQEGKKKSIIDVSGGSSGPSIAFATRGKEFLKTFLLIKKGKNPSTKALLSMAINNATNIDCLTMESDYDFINKIRYEIFNNNSLKEILNLTFINDTNILYIFSYLPFFFKAYIECNSKPFCVSLPTGNLSLGMSAYFATMLGIPIKKIILATEKNNFFKNIQESKVAINEHHIDSGVTSIHTNIPNNFERLLFYLNTSNQGSVVRTMLEIENTGRYKISDALFEKFHSLFFVAQCDNQFAIRNQIYNTIREKNYFVEQHFAISKIATDIATNTLGSEISNLPMVVFNTLDYRRNISFVNASMGYDLQNIKYPWNNEDGANFAITEIKPDSYEILKYILDKNDNKTIDNKNEEKKKDEE